MDLWIRSQDREVLTKTNNLCYRCREDVLHYLSVEDLSDDMEHFIWSPDGAILGVYKSKERALEVLNEIQSLIRTNFDCYYNKKEDAYIACNSVYEMPKE